MQQFYLQPAHKKQKKKKNSSSRTYARFIRHNIPDTIKEQLYLGEHELHYTTLSLSLALIHPLSPSVSLSLPFYYWEKSLKRRLRAVR